MAQQQQHKDHAPAASRGVAGGPESSTIWIGIGNIQKLDPTKLAKVARMLGIAEDGRTMLDMQAAVISMLLEVQAVINQDTASGAHLQASASGSGSQAALLTVEDVQKMALMDLSDLAKTIGVQVFTGQTADDMRNKVIKAVVQLGNVRKPQPRAPRKDHAEAPATQLQAPASSSTSGSRPPPQTTQESTGASASGSVPSLPWRPRGGETLGGKGGRGKGGRGMEAARWLNSGWQSW